MLTLRQWLKYVFGPLALVIVIDQITKALAAAWWAVPRDVGPLHLAYDRNAGFFMGSLERLSPFETVVLPTAIGGVLLFAFFAVQYFLPIKSVLFRTGLAVFVGAALSNLGERLATGAVGDFLQLSLAGYGTGLFNVADALQWLGVALFLGSFLANGALLYPAEQRRGRKWIDAKFQARYCAILTGSVALGMTLAGAIGAAFLQQVTCSPQLRTVFFLVFGTAAAGLLVATTMVGVIASHRIVGPLKAFEKFLDGVANGEATRLSLRQGDELRQLEALSDRFLETVGEKLGIEVEPLAPGQMLSGARAHNFRDELIDFEALRGRRVWLMLMRYPSCPLCADYLDRTRDLITKALSRGVAVLAVYEATAAHFAQDESHAVRTVKALGIEIIVDPDRKLYRRFRARSSLRAVFNWRMLEARWRAHKHGFGSSNLSGKLGQRPAHILVDERGIIRHSFVAESIADHIDPRIVETFVDHATPSEEISRAQ
jgi:signal peptidase II